ncbi:PDR ABC-type transporter family protein [Tanacetum coccineum]
MAPQQGVYPLCSGGTCEVGQAKGYQYESSVNNISEIIEIISGLASDIIINRRMEVIKSIQYLDKIHVMDLAQKAKTISIDQQTELEGAVSKEEVKKAVWDCGSDKSPGPDGFSFGFYRKFWTSGGQTRGGAVSVKEGQSREVVDADMARGRGRRGGITRRELLSYAHPRITDESLTDPTSNGDEIVSDSTSNGNGNETSHENVVVTNLGSRSTIESSQNLSLTEGGRKQLSVVNGFEDTWAGFVAYWDTPEYKGKQETNSQNYLKGDGPSTHTGGSVSYHEYAKKLETTLKRPPNPFELFVYTHTKNHDKETFIDKKAKTINDNMLRLREACEENHAEGESSQSVNESALYYEAVRGVKKRNVYGLSSQAFAYYLNPANRNLATYMPHVPLENKYLEMERKLTRKISKQQQILELLCSHLDIPAPSTKSDTKDNNEANTVGGTQNPNTSNSEEHEV